LKSLDLLGGPHHVEKEVVVPPGALDLAAHGALVGLGAGDVQRQPAQRRPAAIADLEAKGAEFLMKPRDGKGRIAFVKGPDSVNIGLVQTDRRPR